MKQDYKQVSKLHTGPGGLKCSCCNPYRCAPDKMKPKSRRLARRVMKNALKNEVSTLDKE